jgi:C4-dicarboxylate-specific signal transduction histidine kinase
MSPPKPRALSRQLVFLLVLFSLGPLVISNIWGYLTARELISDSAMLNLRNVAALEASRTTDFVKNQQAFLKTTLADNQHLFTMLRTLLLSDDPEIRQAAEAQLHKHLLAKAAHNHATDELFVVSPQGNLLGSSNAQRAVESQLWTSPCFRAGQTGTAVATIQFKRAEPDLLLGFPIHDGALTYLGVLCGRFAFDVHDDLVAAHSSRTPNAELYLLDGDGHVICGSFEHLGRGQAKPALPPSYSRPLFGNVAWSGRYALASGDDAIAAYTPIPKLGWSVLVEVPLAHVMGVLDRLKWRATLLGMLLVVVVALLAYGAGHSVVRPLGRLVDAARRASSGVLGELVPAGGPAEVADLVVTFNRMSTALKESHEALERRVTERTVFAELLLNSIDQPVVVVDRTLRLISANRAALRAHGSDLVGASYREILQSHAGPDADKPVQQAFETARPAAADRALKLAGSAQIVHLEAFPVFGGSGQVESAVCIERVVTAERSLLAQTMHHEKMAAFGLLAAGMAHEIGNPLASIQWQLSMARETGEVGQAEPMLRAVEREVRRISELLRDLASVTQRKRGEEVTVGPNQVVRDVARLLGHDPRAKNCQIELSLAENVPFIRAKEDHLTQVLLNLGINGLDSMGGSGTLVFETSTEDTMAVVRVRDTGGGLDPSIADHIFEPFFTTKPPGRGTGLGLFVSRGIVEALGGEIALEKSTPDGTTFAIRIPLRSDATEEVES